MIFERSMTTNWDVLMTEKKTFFISGILTIPFILTILTFTIWDKMSPFPCHNFPLMACRKFGVPVSRQRSKAPMKRHLFCPLLYFFLKFLSCQHRRWTISFIFYYQCEFLPRCSSAAGLSQMEKLDRNPVLPRIFQSLIHIQLHQLPILFLSSAFVFPAEFFRTLISPGDTLLNALGPVLR